MNHAKSAAVRYEVIISELCFSGALGAPLVWASCKGKGAKQRAIECAEREFPTRASIVSVTVLQRGGRHDGSLVWSRQNLTAYMHAGETYCAGVFCAPDGRIMAIRAVSRDSRITYTEPPTYTLEEMKDPDPNTRAVYGTVRKTHPPETQYAYVGKQRIAY